jgi:hypothetical protein
MYMYSWYLTFPFRDYTRQGAGYRVKANFEKNEELVTLFKIDVRDDEKSITP